MRNSTSHALPIPGRQAVALGAFCVLFSGVSVLSDGFDGEGTLGGIFEHYGSLGGLCTVERCVCCSRCCLASCSSPSGGGAEGIPNGAP